MQSDHNVLLVEDNGDDAHLIQRAMRRTGMCAPVHVISDGESACDYLHGAGVFADRTLHPFPTLVLLDLKLPRRSGIEVLRYVRTHPVIAQLIVVVFTSSREPEDVARAYQAGANSYLVKPIKPDDMNGMLDTLNRYWLESNIPPAACGAPHGHADPGHR